MAWNEPGKRDPWRGKDQGPDVEETLRKLKDGIGRLFGGGGGGGGGGLVLFAAGLLLALLMLDSWSVINAREVGVVLRFGQFSRVMTPGFNLKWPRPIETVTKVETSSVRQVTDQVRMLTQDENIVLIDFNVQFQVTDAQKFLFKIRKPEDTLKQAAESAVRSVMGANDMDTILSPQGAELVTETRKVLQQTLDSYDCGIQVTDVSFQNSSPPHEVKPAFDDVNKAREDKQRIENNAQAYLNNVVPLARGEAAQVSAEAEGYRAERIARAQGDADRFNQLVSQYKAAPEVTRKRLYLETMQSVLSASNKVLDMSNGKNLINLPLGTSTLDAARAAATTQAVIGDGTERKETSR
jgi:membrane protease subunit HflK